MTRKINIRLILDLQASVLSRNSVGEDLLLALP